MPIGALITNILIIDDIRDREFDAVKGKNTVAVRFGPKWSRIEFVALLCASYAALPWFWLGLNLGAWVMLPLLTVPFAVAIVRAVLTLDRFIDLIPMTPKTAQLTVGYATLLALGLALGR